jgi:hypothetical protein
VKITDNGLDPSWQARIESEEAPEELWTPLNISTYTGDNEPQEIWFEKGHRIIIHQVLKAVCAKCGPLLLLPDTGDTPEVINT